ncbi:MAG: YicC family protein [Cytophagales bacterium]|nr:YicC family protein [Cytophagales bacterium]
MLHSMTGFGQAENDSNGLHVKVEVKTLNSKFLDLNLKLPREISDKETEIRNNIGQILKRGKINVLIEFSFSDDQARPVHINEKLLATYFKTYQRVASELNDTPPDLFRLALHSPEVVAQKEGDDELIDWQVVQKTIIGACESCHDFRAKEGSVLEEKLKSYIETIQEKLDKIQQRDGKRIENIRSRLDKNLDEIRAKTQVDPNRFEQELIYYIEKIDITEEKVRLQRHLEYFLEVMSMADSQGKKLGFISQEIGREINTIGSKANDADVQQLVVEMKDELEKIKEQLLNII